jgi:hypothetical protein
MLEHIPFLTGVGVLLVFIGGGMLIWPRAIVSISQNENGKSIPLTSANIWRMWLFGLAIVTLGILFIAIDLLQVKGADDAGLI